MLATAINFMLRPQGVDKNVNRLFCKLKSEEQYITLRHSTKIDMSHDWHDTI